MPVRGGSIWTIPSDFDLSLSRKGCYEPVHRVGVLGIPEQLAAYPSPYVSPREQCVCGSICATLQRFLDGTHRSAVPACQHSQPPVVERQPAATLDLENDDESLCFQPLQHLPTASNASPPTSRPRWEGVIHGQSEIRSRARFSVAFRIAGQRVTGGIPRRTVRCR